MQTKRRKKYIESVMTMFMAFFICMTSFAQESSMVQHSAAKNLIWEKKLERQVTFLSDTICQGRGTGSRASKEAAFWIEREFRKTGLLKIDSTYTKHFFAGHGHIGHNIMGMLPGSLKSPKDRYVIVGAHYDHLGMLDGKIYPGADANASGVTAMLSLAQMFSSMRTLGKGYDSNIIFVAFDAKELSMTGSQAVWRMIKDGDLHDPVTGESITPEKIMLMVNIDQVGSTLSPLHNNRPDYLIMLGTHSLRHSDQGLLEYCNRRYGLYMDISLDYYGSKNFTDVFYTLSDQKILVQNRIPAVLFTSGITMNTNKTWDTVENLDMGILKKRIYLIYHWLDHIL
jgi:hypothetical protein